MALSVIVVISALLISSTFKSIAILFKSFFTSQNKNKISTGREKRRREKENRRGGIGEGE
jgi:hypothetical protein